LFACFGLCLVAALLAWFGTRHVALLRQGELLLDDFRLAQFAPMREQRSDVIALTIDEEALAQFPFRSPINRRFVADLVTTLSDYRLRALGIDLIFDQPTTPDDDAALLAALDSFGAPVVVAVGDAANGLTPRQLEFQDRFLAGRNVGLAGMLVTNGTVRHIYPGEQAADRFRPGFAVALAALAGVAPSREPTLLYYRTARDGAPAIRHFPAQHLAALPRAWFDGAIVMIGADLPNQDTFRTPLSVPQGGADMPGILIHAQALAQMLDGVSYPAVGGTAEALLVALAALVGVLLPFAPQRLHWKALIALGALGAYWTLGLVHFANGGALLPLLSPTLALLLALAFATTYARRRDNLEKRLIRDAFGRYVSPPIIEQILKDSSKLALGGEKREMSFVFSDLEGFTTLAETLPPERALALLQNYLEGMLRIAFEYGGTVDRIVGDGIAVFFGAPLSQPDHARRAVGCALAWDRYCEGFREAHRADGLALGITRIGVHTGTAIVGNVGTADRLHYTAHGDCVNTAARLEGANRYLGTRVCMSREVAQHSPEIPFVPIGRLVLKGRTQELECVTAGDHLPAEVIDDYLEAYALLDCDGATSEQRFATLAHRSAQRGLPAFHWQRLRRGEFGARIVLEGK
jgi:class 3 adenylate cyclase/CHASE2 domain-containing sensor protein